MKTVDQLIFDALAARRAVALPDIGTLEVRRVGARKISDTQIAPPFSEVALSPEWGAAGSVVSMIAADRGTSESEAAGVYSAWLGGAHGANETVSIGVAGEIREGRFVASEDLRRALNPTDGEAVTVQGARRKPSGMTWVWIAIAALAALMALCVLKCCKNGKFACNKGAAVENVAPAVQTPGDAAPALDPADVSAAEAARDNAAKAEAAASKGSGTSGGYTGADRFHVIVGAFAVESNADNYIARLKREHPELTPVKLAHPTTGYSMVSILQASTERQAVNKMNLYWDLDPGLWIYEQK